MTTENQKPELKDRPVEEKLRLLYELQQVASDIDKIKTLRGELPLEVQDLEDEIAGLKTRISNYEDEIKNLETAVSNKKSDIKESKTSIEKYSGQQDNVRNNREYDSLSKEVEFQKLEIELAEKKIKEFATELATKKQLLEVASTSLTERGEDLVTKKKELNDITSETQAEEDRLKNKALKIEGSIEPRLVTAFKRIRKNARNGLAIVTIQRNACGGCFNKIPPQRQLDIASRRKIIVCEYCGRILVDDQIEEAKPVSND